MIAAEFCLCTDEFSEELLARHEEEISRLKEERRIKGPLLASINKYFDVLNDEKKLVVRRCGVLFLLAHAG